MAAARESSSQSRYGSSVAGPPSNGNTGTREVRHALGLSAAQRPEGGERRSLSRLVDEAAEQITRLAAPDAFAACATDGVIIDIRSQDARELHGVIPGSLHIPRTVLEWRIAIDSPWRNRHLDGLGQRLILICDHGYSSILAASTLVQLGFYRAGDVIGGFESWNEHGLPVARAGRRPATVGGLPGSGPPQ